MINVVFSCTNGIVMFRRKPIQWPTFITEYGHIRHCFGLAAKGLGLMINSLGVHIKFPRHVSNHSLTSLHTSVSHLILTSIDMCDVYHFVRPFVWPWCQIRVGFVYQNTLIFRVFHKQSKHIRHNNMARRDNLDERFVGAAEHEYEDIPDIKETLKMLFDQLLVLVSSNNDAAFVMDDYST